MKPESPASTSVDSYSTIITKIRKGYMMRYLQFLLLVVLLTSCSKPITKEAVRESVQNIMPPSSEVMSVTNSTEIPSLLQVIVKINGQNTLIYMDKSLKFVLSGSLLDVKSKRNLTLEALEKFKASQK